MTGLDREFHPALTLRAITKHSAIPVSEEKDISFPLAAILKICHVRIVILSSILPEALPRQAISHRQGKYQGQYAAGLESSCGPEPRNAEAIPALPW